MTTICKIIFWGAVGWTICYLAIGSIAAAIRSAQLSRRLRQRPVTTADSVFAPDDLYALDSEPIETEDPPVEGDNIKAGTNQPMKGAKR